jgi:hypothetical protein
MFSFISIETSGFLKKIAGKFLKILKKLFSKSFFGGVRGKAPQLRFKLSPSSVTAWKEKISLLGRFFPSLPAHFVRGMAIEYSCRLRFNPHIFRAYTYPRTISNNFIYFKSGPTPYSPPVNREGIFVCANLFV